LKAITLTALRARWNRYWFEPERPSNLGLCRALFYGLLLLLYLFDDVSPWGGVSNAFWFPITLFKFGRIPVLGEGPLFALDTVWKLSLLACALGFATRPASLLAFAFGLYRLGLPHNFGKVHHFDAMIVLVLGVMVFARLGDAWSLDRLIAGRRGRELKPVAASGEYRWPVRAVWVIMALTFFAAGFSKLRHGGIDWVTSENMSIVLNQHAYLGSSHDPLLVDLSLFLSRHPLVCSLIALGTVVIEAGYPLALFSRRARWFFAPAMCGALIGIRVLMGPSFPQFILCHLFWIPWDRVLAKVLRAPAPTPPAVSPA
jgi:hypothetical protein